MTKDEILNYLIKEKKIVKVGEEYYPENKMPYTVKTKSIINKNWCLNFPQAYKKLSSQLIYNRLIDLAEIPTYNNNENKYIMATQTLNSRKVLKSILKDVTLDFNKLISVLKTYYNSGPNVYKTNLAKLLEGGTWRQLYKNGDEVEKPDNTSWQ